MERRLNLQISEYKNITLITIILLGLLIRISLQFVPGLAWFSTDTYDYMNMADAILAGHPIAKFPNGLPLLIAVTKFFFTSDKAPFALICINVILSTLIIWMVALITIQLTKKKSLGMIAALLVALYPNQLNYSRLILSEVPACFLLTLSVFIFLKNKCLLSGLCLFLATLFRSDLLLVFPFIFLVSLFYPSKENRIAKSSYFLAGYIIGSLFYSMLLSHSIVSSTNRYGLEILKSIHADSIKEEYPSINNFNAEEKLHPLRTYVNYMLEHPINFIEHRLSAIENMWGWPPAPFRSLIEKILIAVRLPVFILGIIGFWKYRRNFEAWILLMPILALSIIHIATYSSPRYTFTVEPLLICLASITFLKKSVNQ